MEWMSQSNFQLICLNTHVLAAPYSVIEEGGEMTGRVRPWELQERRRRRLATYVTRRQKALASGWA
jgi:hypothetical protein